MVFCSLSGRRRSCIWLLGWAAVVFDFSSSPIQAETKSAEAKEVDFADELPRISPKSPEAALETLQLPDDFRIELVAAEPLVVDPVAMSFDENGRLYVVEMRGYSEDDQERIGRVRRLVDSNGDGRFDQATVFADGLSWPTAVICYGGGIFVGAAPDILFCRDIDDDGVADECKVVFEGFGRGNVQGLLNTFTWGLDNRIHGATSSSGGEVRRAGEDETLNLNGRDFAFDPKSLTLSATSGGGQHGMSFNRWGDKFVCSNSDHLQAIVYEDRYLARNAYLAIPSPRRSIAADGPQADVFRASAVEPWRIVRTRLRVDGIVPGPVEGGGQPSGYFTSATGLTIYEGDAWPEKYRGWALVGDVGSNLVHRKRLLGDGVSYVGDRVDHKSEFLTSTDIWFRPVQMCNGPDGALYIADMYREVIEHPESLPPMIKRHLDLTSGRDRGRIYRIVHGSHQPRPVPVLGEATTQALVATLDHPNSWHRATAARRLYEQQDQDAVSLLRRLVRKGRLPEGRIAALHALQGLDALDLPSISAGLGDAHPRVRQHAVRLAEGPAMDSSLVREKLLGLVNDEARIVRYQLAFSLGQLTGARRNVALAALARSDVDHPEMLTAVHSSLATGAGSVLCALMTDPDFRRHRAGRTFLGGLAKQIGRQQLSADLALVWKLLRELAESDDDTLAFLVESLGAKPGSPLAEQTTAATGGRADEVIRQRLAEACLTISDSSRLDAKRAAKVSVLRLGSFEEHGKVLARLLLPLESVELQIVALDTLASYENGDVAELLVDRWPSFSPRVRSRAGSILLTRTSWLTTVLHAIEAGRLRSNDLEPAWCDILKAHPDSEISEKAKQLLTASDAEEREQLFVNYQDVLQLSGDVRQGMAIFKKVCAGCHKVENVGHPLAPNLVAMQNRGADSMLYNILVPNREVNPQYVNYVASLVDGRVASGIITAETTHAVTFMREESAKESVLREDIEDLRSTGRSLMPDGLEKLMSKQELADLIAYLLSL